MKSTKNGFMLRLLALAAVLALAAAACGADGEEEEGPAADVQAFCDSYVEVQAAAMAAIERGEGDIESELTSAEETAPAQVEEEVTTVVDAVREALEAEDPFAIIDAPEFQQADEFIDRFVVAECGFETVPATGVEYEFQGVPETLASGRVAIDFSNDGAEVHEMGIVRIDEGVDLTIQELLELPQRESEELVTFVGGLFAAPGESDAEVIELEPGRYGFACFIPEGATSLEVLEDRQAARELGPPHFTLGMFGQLTVE